MSSKEFDRKDVLRMEEKNFKTIMYKKVPVKVASHHKDLEVGIIDTEILLVVSNRKIRE